MKKIVTALALLLATMGVVSCGDLLESSGNGKLDGMWQLVRIDTLATGGYADVAEDRKYLSVQGSILTLRDADAYTIYMFRFVQGEGQLGLSDARYNNREESDPRVTDVEELRPYGLGALETTLRIEKLNGRSMILTTDSLRLSFRRF